jgi:hypothetical protein
MKAFQNRARGKRGAAVGVLAASMLASMFSLAPAAHAADIDGGCSGDDLREAVEFANDNGGDDSISLRKNCTYKFTNGVPGTDAALLIGDPVGDLTIWGNGATIKIDGNTAIRHIDHQGGTLRLNNLTLTGGSIEASPTLQSATIAGSILSAGLLIGEKLTVKDNEVEVFGLTAEAVGGGIVGEIVILVKSTIKDNQVDGYGLTTAAGTAGGVVADVLTLEDTVVKGNEVSVSSLIAAAGSAGGVQVNDAMGDSDIYTSADQEGSSITGNSVAVSAGLLAVSAGGGLVTTAGANPEGTDAAQLGDLVVSGNKASSSGAVALTAGGGLAQLGGALTDDGATISGNKAKCSSSSCASLGGGAVMAGDSDLVETEVKGNTAEAKNGAAAGGGIAYLDGTHTLTDVTVTKNQAKGAFQEGGGLANFGAAVDIDASDIYNNKPDDCFGVLGC